MSPGIGQRFLLLNFRWGVSVGGAGVVLGIRLRCGEVTGNAQQDRGDEFGSDCKLVHDWRLETCV